MKIFVAGASGAVGQSLLPLLVAGGHRVVGTSRTDGGCDAVRRCGGEAVRVDVLDAPMLEQVVADAAPDVVIHQLTSLAGGIDPASPEVALERNARLRRDGTANLVKAARLAGARRLIVQSIAWAYAPGQPPYTETDPLDTAATGTRRITVAEGLIPMEQAVLDCVDLDGIVLRYGQLYGPHTWHATPAGATPLHIQAAAHAAFLAVERGSKGVYNVAEPGCDVSVDKAVTELGWDASFRLAVSGAVVK